MAAQPIDWKWMSTGGLLLDGQGDIAIEYDPLESIKDVIRTRLKADFNGWQLYAIGAGLQNRIGDVVDQELELKIKQQVVSALTNKFLPASAFDVETVTTGDKIHVIVYLQNQPAVQAVLTKTAIEVK